jgi:hypothetical protein
MDNRTERAHAPSFGDEVSRAQVMKAVYEWRSSKGGNGNDSFFKLAVAAKRAGLQRLEVENLLEDEIAWAKSPR